MYLYAVIMVCYFWLCFFLSDPNKTLKHYAVPSIRNFSVIDKVSWKMRVRVRSGARWRSMDGRCWWMEDERQWQDKRSGLHLRACPAIDFPPDLLLHTHSYHISFIYVSSSHGNLFCILKEALEPVSVCMCVFFSVSCQAGGNINDLYLW